MGELRIGTSGYRYEDWVGHFYPENLNPRDWLSYYARHFNTVEVNSTFYSLLPARTLGYMAAKVPDDFEFVIKAYRAFTHERNADESTLREFYDMLRPLLETNKLGCVLLQFPWSFRNEPANRDYLMQVCEALADVSIVVEFRNIGWIKDEVFDFLRDWNIGFCCVDQPRLRGLIPPVAVATSEVSYVRFHGRNKEKWWKHEQPWERYDYLYSRDELREWLPKIKQLSDNTERCYIFFNNHYQGKAAMNAQMLMKLLGGGEL